MASRNISDRGGAGPQWQDHARDELDIGDVRELDARTIADIEAAHGDRGTRAIAAAALRYLGSVRIVPVDRTEAPSMFERLDEIDRAPELTTADRVLLKSDTLRRYGHREHAHRELSRQARERLFDMIAEVAGTDDAGLRRIIARLGEQRIATLLKVPKHERRRALARALEEIDGEEAQEPT